MSLWPRIKVCCSTGTLSWFWFHICKGKKISTGGKIGKSDTCSTKMNLENSKVSERNLSQWAKYHGSIYMKFNRVLWKQKSEIVFLAKYMWIKITGTFAFSLFE